MAGAVVRGRSRHHEQPRLADAGIWFAACRLAPAVRHGDNQWKDIVNYAVLAMIEAEDLGINSRNVDEMLKSATPAVQRFLGVTPGNGKALGLDEKWAYNIVKQVGNYAEIFERSVGKNTPLKLERGLNALWKNGGLLYSPPFR